MLNCITIQVRLATDPEVNQSGNGDNAVTVTRFRVACPRNFKSKGATEVETDFFSAVAFRKTAEFIRNYFTKGMSMIIQGRLQSNNYTDKDGHKKTSVEIVVDEAMFCEPKKDGETGQNAGWMPQPMTTQQAPGAFPAAPNVQPFPYAQPGYPQQAPPMQQPNFQQSNTFTMPAQQAVFGQPPAMPPQPPIPQQAPPLPPPYGQPVSRQEAYNQMNQFLDQSA